MKIAQFYGQRLKDRIVLAGSCSGPLAGSRPESRWESLPLQELKNNFNRHARPVPCRARTKGRPTSSMLLWVQASLEMCKLLLWFV